MNLQEEGEYRDSSDEEDLRNTIGNVPVVWYDGYEHIGYDLDGKKIPSKRAKLSEIDDFIAKEEDPDYWRKVFDRQTGELLALSDDQVNKLFAITGRKYPEIGYNPYEPLLEIYSSQKEIHPISNEQEHKRSFMPSESERRIVNRFIRAIKNGRLKQHKKPEENVLYDLWAGENNETQRSKNETKRIRMHLPAPKVKLPGHSESYNPPPEYLFDDAEKNEWLETEEEKREINFIPRKYEALRKVPFYERFYEERLERCMDLHLAPRKLKKRLNVDPNELLPKLPNPKDLQPFPTTFSFYMRGHEGQVRSLSFEPETGELLVSGGEDRTVRVWYLPTGRCLRQFLMDAPITCVSYCPNSKQTLVLVSCESTNFFVLNIESGDKMAVSSTRKLLSSLNCSAPSTISWSMEDGCIKLTMEDKVRQTAWHNNGDYFATVCFEQSAGMVVIHQLSKCSSQKPFTKSKGVVQCVLFHPRQPLFFVGTRQHVYVYDLVKCSLQRKLFIGTRWLSCMQLHPRGGNLFVGGLDRTLSWLDLELSQKPWKSLRNHSSAIRSVAYHQKYPLLATTGDDATIIVYHAFVSEDLMRENELVPLKRLSGHKFQDINELTDKNKRNDDETKNSTLASDDSNPMRTPKMSILSIVFHPIHAWLITGGTDGKIGVFSY